MTNVLYSHTVAGEIIVKVDTENLNVMCDPKKTCLAQFFPPGYNTWTHKDY